MERVVGRLSVGRNPSPYLLVGAARGVRSRLRTGEIVRVNTKDVENEDVYCCGLLRNPRGHSPGNGGGDCGGPVRLRQLRQRPRHSEHPAGKGLQRSNQRGYSLSAVKLQGSWC